MKKTTLILAFVGIVSTAMFAQTFQDGPKRTTKPAKINQVKPIKKTATAKTIDKSKELSKEQTKKK
ncbi:MAG: hypothetical protein IPL10_05595 [Bacteroidetes bacterium]|jgi:uncharacterized protein YdeI (BOF family)|nr:hypothetical protein [Bacteroidota bacterium]